MGKEYITYFGAKTTKCVDEFERCDENGHLIYSRMIIKDFKNIPSYIGLSVNNNNYWKYGLALIVRRSNVHHTKMTFSQLMKNKSYTSLYRKMDKLLLTPGFIDMLFEKKVYYFDEEDILYFRAQGSKDRSGFYKEWYDGMLIAEKNYGDCSYTYEAIGIKIYKRI